MYPRDVQVKTSPVAQLQVFSPEVCPGNVRNPSASPLTSPMLHKKMTTPRKGLGAPSGAKPRRSVEAFTCICKMFGVFSIAIAAVSSSSLWPKAGKSTLTIHVVLLTYVEHGRLKGDWRKCEENTAPPAGHNSPRHVGSVKILKPAHPQNQSNAAVPRRPPLNCVRCFNPELSDGSVRTCIGM